MVVLRIFMSNMYRLMNIASLKLLQSANFPSQSRFVSNLEVERKFVPAVDFRRNIEALTARRSRGSSNYSEFVWHAEKPTVSLKNVGNPC